MLQHYLPILKIKNKPLCKCNTRSYLYVFPKTSYLKTNQKNISSCKIFLEHYTLLPSLQEVLVSIAAIRIGTIDLAIGNIFGSNIFNIAILAFNDMLYTKGPILQYTSANHIKPVLGTIIIMAIGIIGIVFKEQKKWKLAIDTILIAVVYVLMMGLLYHKK